MAAPLFKTIPMPNSEIYLRTYTHKFGSAGSFFGKGQIQQIAIVQAEVHSTTHVQQDYLRFLTTFLLLLLQALLTEMQNQQ